MPMHPHQIVCVYLLGMNMAHLLFIIPLGILEL